jgi:hypothetical protein
MGLTTLLTNSQSRGFIPLLFYPINIFMLRKTIPTVYIDRVPNYSFNVSLIIKEFEDYLLPFVVDVNDGRNNIIVQRKFHLIKNNTFQYTNVENIPYILETINKITDIFSFDSVNFRYVMPNTAYNWHFDTGSNCLHIPLISNEGCWFVYKNKSFSMPADGSLYTVNNGKHHTFVNAGAEPRLHMTFEILD